MVPLGFLSGAGFETATEISIMGLMTNNRPPQFDSHFREQLHERFVWRRGVRRFRSNPLPPGLPDRLIGEACLAPSVGLSQPWRFVLVDDAARCAAIIANSCRCDHDALDTYEGERRVLHANLKLEGLHEAPHHLAVFADEATSDGQGLGQHTMPGNTSPRSVCFGWPLAPSEPRHRRCRN
jgi:5,6-dimethylbenzimidazole synthase